MRLLKISCLYLFSNHAELTIFLMSILFGAFLLLDITTVNAQPESPLQTSCNTCCQGPIGGQGNPGIPGVPGTNGMPGNLGPKGDRGESIKGDVGLPGEKGDSGSPGLKGESGMVGLQGPPGKIGPQGEAGLVGSPGLPGVKGQKGEMGQSRVSAFTAVRSTSYQSSSTGQAVPFETMHTNVGEDFDVASGRFTCEIPGIYMFTYNFLTSTGDPFVTLMKNDEKINSAYRDSESFNDMIGNAAVLQLANGEQVWLQYRYANKQIHSNGNIYTTFTGVLIHEI